MKAIRRVVLASAAVAFLALAAGPAQGQMQGVNDRFRLDLGGFFQKFETTLSLSNSAGTAGTEVNLEDDLGQDANQTTFMADGHWRFGRHGRMDFAYRGWKRSNSHTLTKDIVFGDTTYHVGANLDSTLRVNVGELYYSYSFVNNGDLEFGLGLGLSAYWTSAELTGAGSVSGGGGGSSGTIQTSGRSVVVPIPAAKAYFAYSLYPGLFVSAAVKGISGTYDSYHASMVDWRAGVDYVFTKNFGAGASYQYVKIDFSHAGTAAEIGFTYKYSGPLAYVILAF
jgi:hypothetical protein